MECIREHLSFQNVIFHHHYSSSSPLFPHWAPAPEKRDRSSHPRHRSISWLLPRLPHSQQGPTSFGLGTAHHPVYMACIYLYENPYAIVDRYWNWIDFMEYGTQGETDYYTKQHQRNRCHEVFGFISESNSQSGNGLIWRCINMNLPLNRSCGWTVLGA